VVRTIDGKGSHAYRAGSHADRVAATVDHNAGIDDRAV